MEVIAGGDSPVHMFHDMLTDDDIKYMIYRARGLVRTCMALSSHPSPFTAGLPHLKLSASTCQDGGPQQLHRKKVPNKQG